MRNYIVVALCYNILLSIARGKQKKGKGLANYSPGGGGGGGGGGEESSNSLLWR